MYLKNHENLQGSILFYVSNIMELNNIMQGVCNYLKRKVTFTFPSYNISISALILKLQTTSMHGSQMLMG